MFYQLRLIAKEKLKDLLELEEDNLKDLLEIEEERMEGILELEAERFEAALEALEEQNEFPIANAMDRRQVSPIGDEVGTGVYKEGGKVK